MRLAYLYIDNFRNFTNEEFNFSTDFSIHYDKDTNSLSICQNESKLPENFWGENIQDLFMIVGNNGAGKTGVMQFIIKLFIEMSININSQNHAPEECGFVIFEEDGKFYSYILGNLRLKCSIPQITNLHGGLKRTKLIYLTNVLSSDDSRRNQYPAYDRYSFLYDCSISALFHANNRNDVYSERNIANGVSQLDTYLIYEQYKQIKFVFDRNQSQILKEMKKDFRIPVPQKLYVGIIVDDQLDILLPEIRQKSWETPLEKFTFGFKPLWGKEFRYLTAHAMQSSAAEYFPYILARCTIRSLFSSLVRLMPEGNRAKFLKEVGQRIANEKDGFAYFEYIVDGMCNVVVQSGEIFISNNEYLSYARHLCDNKHYYLDFLKFIFNERISEHFQIIEPEKWLIWDYSTLHCSIDTSDEWFITFLKKYRYVCNPDYFLNFDWGLSSGEKNLISLFSSLYYIFDRDYTNEKNGAYKIYNKWKGESDPMECDSLILMLDEADLTYHPEWQREFINIFTGFLTKIYPPECCKNIQLFISTHSPILLSDMPGKNVIYLKYDPKVEELKTDNLDPNNAKGKKSIVQKSLPGETFGQNIYTLFKYNFFLENGTIGALAEKKIKKLIEDLEDLEKLVHEKNYNISSLKHDLNEFWTLAKLVGEPIISGKLKLRIQQIANQIKLPEQEDNLSQLSDDDLGKQIERLQKEQERRKNDKNS